MKMPTTLYDYYQYWNEFVREWLDYHTANSRSALNIGVNYDKKWTIPQNMYGSNKPDIETIQYMPEPWWGNDGTHIFQAVFLNLNPGNGGGEQNINYIKNCIINSYQNYVSDKVDTFVNNKEFKVYVNNKYQKSTTEWLLLQRVKPFLNALEFDYFTVRNSLGIDLIPWHTPSFNQITKEYIKKNANAICNYSIKFALTASREIKGKLQNVVVARVPCQLFIDILRFSNEIQMVECQNYYEKDKNEILTLRYNGEQFYIMVLSGARNNLPSKQKIQAMQQLIEQEKNNITNNNK